MIVYLIAAAVAITALAGAALTIEHRGAERGRAEVQVKWDADVAARQAEAEADRMRQDAIRAAQDQEATRRLANAKKRTTELTASLEAHIRAAGSAGRCPIPPSLLDDWNRASAGPTGQGERPGAVPPAGRAPAAPN